MGRSRHETSGFRHGGPWRRRWHAANSDPEVVEIDEMLMSAGTSLTVKVLGEGESFIEVTGKKNEIVTIAIDTQK